MHDSKLDNMELVIERTGHHLESRSRLLVQRPKSHVVRIQVAQKRAHGLLEKRLRGWITRGKKVVIHTPGGPDESVENMRRRRDDVLLEPQITPVIRKDHTAILDWQQKTGKCFLGGVQILRLARLVV